MYLYITYLNVYLYMYLCVDIYFIYNAVLLKISVLGAMELKEAASFFFFPLVHFFDNFEN